MTSVTTINGIKVKYAPTWVLGGDDYQTPTKPLPQPVELPESSAKVPAEQQGTIYCSAPLADTIKTLKLVGRVVKKVSRGSREVVSHGDQTFADFSRSLLAAQGVTDFIFANHHEVENKSLLKGMTINPRKLLLPAGMIPYVDVAHLANWLKASLAPPVRGGLEEAPARAPDGSIETVSNARWIEAIQIAKEQNQWPLEGLYVPACFSLEFVSAAFVSLGFRHAFGLLGQTPADMMIHAIGHLFARRTEGDAPVMAFHKAKTRVGNDFLKIGRTDHALKFMNRATFFVTKQDLTSSLDSLAETKTWQHNSAATATVRELLPKMPDFNRELLIEKLQEG